MKQSFFSPAQVFSEYLKVQNIIFTSIQLEAEVLNKHRQFYNPNKFSGQIEEAYKSQNLLKIIDALNVYSYNSFLFYFLPLWIISFPFYLFFNLKNLKSAWLNISFSISEYRIWTRNSLVSSFRATFNLKIIVSFFPFIFGLSYVIYSRYQNQVFTYFIHKNLPGVYPSFPKLKWETFQSVICPQLIPENTNEFFNFNSQSNSKESSIKAGNSQLATTSVSKLNKFIKQVDFYNDSFLIKLNSNWLNKKKQIYVGVFPKNDYLLNYFKIGNNWHLVSPKDCITFSYILPTKSLNNKFHFTKTENPTQYKIRTERIESEGKFYLNLDELPKKLNSRNTSISKVSSEKQLRGYSSQTSLYKLPDVYISEAIENLPLKNYLDEYQDFIIDASSRDMRDQCQVVPINSLNKKVADNSTKKSENNGIILKRIIFKYQKIYNLIDRKENSNLNKPLIIQTLSGFSTNYPRNGFKQADLTPESLLRNKFNLLQNELRQYFYNNGLKSLPSFLRLATNLNIYETFSSLLLRREFVLANNQVVDQSIQDDNPTFLNLSTFPLNSTQAVDSTLIQNNKPINNRRLLTLSFQREDVPSQINSLENNGKVLLAKLTRDELVILSQLGDYLPEQILHILQDFGPFKMNVAIQPRIMSGYEFPDTPSLELRSLISQYFYQTTASLSLRKNPLSKRKIEGKLESFSPSFKVELPPSFTSYLNYNYSNPEIPSFRLQCKHTVFEIVKGKEKITVYDGPGVLRNDLNRKINVINKEEIHEWMEQFFSLEHPLTDRRQVFFGHNLTKRAFSNDDLALKKQDGKLISSNEDNSIKVSTLSSQPADFKVDSSYNSEVENLKFQISPYKSISHESNLVDVQKIKRQVGQTLDLKAQPLNEANFNSIYLSILPSTKEFQVPYLDKSEWDTVVQRLKTNFEQQLEDKSELEDKFQVDAPLISTRSPKQQNIKWPLNQLDYQNLNDFIFTSGSREAATWVGSSTAPRNVLFNKTAILTPSQRSSIVFEDITYPTLEGFPEGEYSNKPSEVLLRKSNQWAQNTSLLRFFLGKKLIDVNYHYSPSAQISLNENLSRTKLFGNVYKKAFTVYKNIFENKYESFNGYKINNYTDSLGKQAKLVNLTTNAVSSLKGSKHPVFDFYVTRFADNIKSSFLNNFSTIFYQSWEPITIGSWMMVTQLSFGLIVLRILQEFYRKYGKEVLSYLLDLIASLGIIDENLKEELGLDDGPKGFRLIKKVPKRFRDIAGIDSILPELGEIVWFLRNSGRSFKVGNIIPKGILLIGSPGTGKTLLVQAIAGEAEVPVLIQSGSSLNDPGQEGGGAQNLKNLFEQARKMAPCIVFIDEIDALGEKRENVIQNPMGEDEIIESIQKHGDFSNLANNQFIPKPKIEFSKNNDLDREQQDLVHSLAQEEGANKSSASSENTNLGIVQQSIDKQEARQEQLRILMQFLIEMDGLRARKGVIVIGATNRPEVLDLALTRPGRFDQTLQLGLPKKKKRIDILKLYSKNLGIAKDISWDYLAKRTVGFSAADLAAVMNESSIKAILGETIHTIETIEEGIESITSYSSERIEIEGANRVDPFFISRLAYYQAGKAVVHTLLLQHPPITVLHLWPRRKNARHTYISSIIEKKFLKISRKLELESRVVGLYAGKAAELLILSNNLSSNLKTDYLSESFLNANLEKPQPRLTSQVSLSGRNQRSQSAAVFQNKLSQKVNLESKRLWQSDIGIEDLNFATSLVESMISKWYFYSKNLTIRNSNQIFYHRNLQEISELDTIGLFNQLAIETETGIIKKTRSSGLKRDFQKWSIRPWWQTQITRKIGLLDPAYDDWYRIYLPDPEESDRNEEWIPPDEYYHNNNNLSDLALNSKSSSINWNDLYASDRDYISHSLLLTCFNTAFIILDKNRELLDYLASYLMRNEVLREHEINEILLQFRPDIILEDNASLNKIQDLKFGESSSKSKIRNPEIDLFTDGDSRIEQIDSGLSINEVSNIDEQQTLLLEKSKKLIIIEKSWGKYSRRQMFRFFRF